MPRALTLLLVAALSIVPAAAEGSSAPRVLLETSRGPIVLELDPERAPRTVESFLEYVRSGFYAGTVFHRVIPGFMIQGGGFTAEMEKKPAGPPVRNEADNGLRNLRGTVAMARTGDPHSANSQFFINLVDNDYLNHTAKTPQGWGYTVFGRVVEGMETVDAIAGVRTTRKGPYSDVPAEPVRITGARVVERTTASVD
jgi:cyclophilin family peptidyl-prolyl cis-trans isomerase